MPQRQQTCPLGSPVTCPGHCTLSLKHSGGSSQRVRSDRDTRADWSLRGLVTDHLQVAGVPRHTGQTACGTRLLFLEKVDWTADCFPLISRTEVRSLLKLPVLFLHRLILIAFHRVPSVIAGDSPRCQALARASASPLRIKLNDLTSRTAGPPLEVCGTKKLTPPSGPTAPLREPHWRTPVLGASI